MSPSEHQRNRRAAQPTVEDLATTQGSALWGLTMVLGEIAERVERQRTLEHVESVMERRNGLTSDPTRRGGAE